MKIKGKTYKERNQYQLDEWVKENSIHNDVDDECCPDFSCCKPELLQPLEIRKTFKAVSDSGDEQTKMSMLMGFLGGLVSTESKNIYVTDGHTNQVKDLN
jgi:hypothetical protein